MNHDELGDYLVIDQSIDGQPRCYLIEDMLAAAPVNQSAAAIEAINLYNCEIESIFFDSLPRQQSAAVKVCTFSNGGI